MRCIGLAGDVAIALVGLEVDRPAGPPFAQAGGIVPRPAAVPLAALTAGEALHAWRRHRRGSFGDIVGRGAAALWTGTAVAAPASAAFGTVVAVAVVALCRAARRAERGTPPADVVEAFA